MPREPMKRKTQPNHETHDHPRHRHRRFRKPLKSKIRSLEAKKLAVQVVYISIRIIPQYQVVDAWVDAK
jgi:hypothetical protein